MDDPPSNAELPSGVGPIASGGIRFYKCLIIIRNHYLRQINTCKNPTQPPI